MLKIRNYAVVQSIDEAYTLLQNNKTNRIIGGMLWLKMMDIMVHTAIDLSECNLDQIEEKNGELWIGAMVSLRSLETSSLLETYDGGVMKQAVKHIVGVQFRNLATIGGSVASKFGFSDVICALMGLNCDVVLHHGGRMSLASYLEKKEERDVLTHIVLSSKIHSASYQCIRKSATDLPVLTLCLGKAEQYIVSVGSRPKKAVRFVFEANTPLASMIETIMQEVELEDNGRASAKYREMVLPVLLKRAYEEVSVC